MAILLCKVPLNKDRERERERKRGNSSSSRATGTCEVYICAEVVGNKCRLNKHFVVTAKK